MSAIDPSARSSRPYAFTFWQGVSGTPAYIEMCLETHQEVLGDDFELVHLDLDAVCDWVPEHELLWAAATPTEQDNSYSLEARHIAMFTGMVRAGLLARHGGLWVDADMLALPPLRLLAPLVGEYDLVCGELQNGGISNGVLGACSGSRRMRAYWETILERADERKGTGQGAEWGEFGVFMLTDTFLRHPERDDGVWVAPWGAFDNLNWRFPRPTFESGSGIEVLPPFAMDVCIFNNATGDDVRKRTRSQLLAEQTVFSDGYRIAMGERESAHLAIRSSSQLRALNRANLVWHGTRELQGANNLATRVQERAERLEEDLRLRTEQRDTARRQRDTSRQQRDTARKQRDAAQARAGELRRQRDEARERVQRLRESRAALKAELDKVGRRRKTLRRLIGALRRRAGSEVA